MPYFVKQGEADVYGFHFATWHSTQARMMIRQGMADAVHLPPRYKNGVQLFDLDEDTFPVPIGTPPWVVREDMYGDEEEPGDHDFQEENDEEDDEDGY